MSYIVAPIFRFIFAKINRFLILGNWQPIQDDWEAEMLERVLFLPFNPKVAEIDSHTL